MNWTSQLPTKPGDYAWKDSDGTSDPYKLIQVELFEPEDVPAYLADADSCDAVSVIGGLWCRLVPADQVERHCRDWADAHTHAQKAAKRWGATEFEIEGDRNGVPGIEELIDTISRWASDEVEKAWNEGAEYGDKSRSDYERGGLVESMKDAWNDSRARRVFNGEEVP